MELNYKKIQDYGIYILIFLYLMINIYYRNCINIGVLAVTMLLSFYFIKNLQYALIIAYVVSIVIGIVKNFHLLENFKTGGMVDKLKNDIENAKKNNELLEKSMGMDIGKNDDSESNEILNLKNNNSGVEDKELDIFEDNFIKMLNTNNKKMEIKLEQSPNIKSLVSERLIQKYIEKLKREDVGAIKTIKMNIHDLKPSIPSLSAGKIQNMRKAINNNQKFIFGKIVISNDNFIIDGHHRWYTRKTFINENTGGSSLDKRYQKYIDVIIVDRNIRKLVNELREFKTQYNESEINNFKFDDKKVKEAEKCIKNIKTNIAQLESYYKEIKSVPVV